MDSLLQVFILILRLTTGQRVSIYNRMRPIAARLGPPVLVRRIEVAHQHEMQLRDVENHWDATNRRGLYAGQVSEIDDRVDSVVKSVRDIAASQAAGLEPTHPTAVMADDFLAEVFPHGVFAITSLPYIDQVVAVEVILAKLQNGLAGTVAQLGLSDKVALLAELNAEYRRLVDLGKRTTEYAEVRAGRDLGQQYLREIIAIVLGTFHDSSDDTHVAARRELLEPVMDQLAIQRAKIRAQRRNGGVEDGEVEPGDDTASDADLPDDDGVAAELPGADALLAAEPAAGASAEIPAAEPVSDSIAS